MDIDIFINIFPELLSGIGMTLTLFFSSISIGFVLAVGLFALQIHDKAVINRPARFVSYAIRGIPLLVQLYIVYYGLGQFEWLRSSVAWPLLREAFWCAILTLSIVNCAFTAEIMRGAYQAVPKGLTPALRG
ncbi:ABC transporter permease subunit [Kiloniella litopenaei]|uniref:ABC transporter permease subunit n=1 Tax=Kiloniella litopenaei TaxID=1549748 RepID=UPI000695E290|nr:ABC transporter permease subunit [Kiloniella litopenaei]